MANAITNITVGTTTYGVAPEFIYGTQTASTGAWTGVTKDSELFDGKIIEYFLPFAGSGNATLNLTLADGTTTGAKNCYYSGTTRLTTHYSQYSQFTLIYHNALNIGGTNYEGWWVADKGYYTSNIYDQYKAYSAINTKAALYRYKLCVTVNETQLLPLNSVNSTSSAWTSKTMTTESFDPFGAIYYYGSTTAVSANSAVNNWCLYIMYSLVDVTYSLSANPSLVANKALYLVCVPQSDGLVKLDSSIVTQTLPTSADGKVYIYLGQMYDSYRLALMPNHPVYEYKNGGIRLYSGTKDSVASHSHAITYTSTASGTPSSNSTSSSTATITTNAHSHTFTGTKVQIGFTGSSATTSTPSTANTGSASATTTSGPTGSTSVITGATLSATYTSSTKNLSLSAVGTGATDVASTSHTHTLSHTHSLNSHTHTVTAGGSISVAANTQGNYTPAGTLNDVTVTGTAAHTHSLSNHTHSYDKANSPTSNN